MKILIISQYFWPENFRINDLALDLKRRGHDVTVLTGMPNYPEGRYHKGYGMFRHPRDTLGELKIIRVPIVPRGRGRHFQLFINYLSFFCLASVRVLCGLRRDADVVYVYAPSPITVVIPAIVHKWLWGTPLMLHVLDLWPESLEAVTAVRSRWILKAVEKMVAFSYKRCDRILVQSRRFIPMVLDCGARTETVRYFPSWAEEIFEQTSDAAVGRTFPKVPTGFRIMFAGNIGAAQDFGTVLDAAELLRDHSDIQWVIVGGGRRLDWAKREARKRSLGHCVHFLGKYPLDDMPSLFSLADVMLVSLKSAPAFTMTVPGKLQSYLACGRPVIAMLEGEGAAIVRESNSGVTCAPEDAMGLSEAVLHMRQQSREQLAILGNNGRQYYNRHFRRDKLMSQLELWMEEVSMQVKLDENPGKTHL